LQTQPLLSSDDETAPLIPDEEDLATLFDAAVAGLRVPDGIDDPKDDGPLRGQEIEGPSFILSIEEMLAIRMLLEQIKVRAIAGYKPFRCLGCNKPHIDGRVMGKPCDCPHHLVEKMLENYGFQVR
jgi:hypothetical protein